MTSWPTSFNAQARHINDSQQREFADHWYLHQEKDLTIQDGISYGGLLRLPVFLLMTETFQKKTRLDSIWKLVKTIVAMLWMFASLLVRPPKKNPQNQHSGREYAFLYAKHAPTGAIAKTLDPIIQALNTRGESVRLFTFDEKQRDALQTQYPTLPCVNLSEGSVSFSHVWSLFRMLVRTTCILLFSAKRANLFDALGQWYYHAPRFLQIDQSLETELHKDTIIVSATEMHPHERLVFTRAKTRTISTILIQHGVTDQTIKNQVVNTPSIASHVFVWGEHAKRYFLKHGVPEQRVTVTGSPALTSLFHSLKRPSRETILTPFALPNRAFILFSGQHFDREKNTALCTLMLEAYKRFSSMTQEPPALLITPHPAKSPYSTVSFYTNLVEKHDLNLEGNVFVRSAKNQIGELLEMADLLITSSSTLHVEAAIKGIPVILLNIDGVPDMDMVTDKAARAAHTEEELTDALRSLQNPIVRESLQTHVPRFLESYISYPDNAVTRVTEKLLTIR